MKKLISVFLAVIISLSCVTVAFASDSTEELGFAVASDLHICAPKAELEKTNNDPIFWYANRRAALENESSFIADSFLAQCERDDSVEFVLISGDITDSGYYYAEEHELAVEKLRAFEERSGKQVYVINGNHDARNQPVTPQQFKQYYAEFGYDQALEVREGDCSYTADLGSKYRLIALDSCDPDKSTADGMTADKLNWVRKQAEKAKADGRYPILMMHHNLLNHMPLQTIISKDFIVKNQALTAELFANWGIKLVFTGHEHCSDVTSYTSSQGNVITDFATTALSMYPIAYRVFSLKDGEIKYTSKKVEAIDTAALTQATEGYTEEMLEAMSHDLNGYAKSFLKRGVQYRLELSLSPEKLNLDESAVYYDLVMSAVNKLTASLNQPLYGKNSLSERGAIYGITLPQSGYANGWDVATELVSAHYAGGESLTLDSPEVTILLRAVAIILREELSVIGDELFMKSAKGILEKSGMKSLAPDLEKLTVRVFGGITPAEYFTVSLLSPVLYEFAFDADGVDDNNGSLPGYGTVSFESNTRNITENLKAFFLKLLDYLKMTFKMMFPAR